MDRHCTGVDVGVKPGSALVAGLEVLPGLPSCGTEGFHLQRNAPASRGRELQYSIHLRLEEHGQPPNTLRQKKETVDSLDGGVYDILDKHRRQPGPPEPPHAQAPTFRRPSLRPVLRSVYNDATTQCYGHMTVQHAARRPSFPLPTQHVASSAKRLPQHEQWLQPAAPHVQLQ